MDINCTVTAGWAALLFSVLGGLLQLFGMIHPAFRFFLLGVWAAHLAYVVLDHHGAAHDMMLFSLGAGYATLLAVIAVRRTKLMR